MQMGDSNKLIVLNLNLFYNNYSIWMLNDYDRLLREYNVPPGVLSEEELRMLREGGIPEDDDYEA